MISNEVVGEGLQIMVMAIVLSVLLLFLGIGILVVIHVCIAGRAIRRRLNLGIMVERSSGGNGNNRRCSSMSHEEVDKLPSFDYQEEEKGVDCAVCLESFKVGDKCRLLPVCKHSFHVECVDSWLVKTPVCPICRSKVNNNQKNGVGEEGGGSGEIVIQLTDMSTVN